MTRKIKHKGGRRTKMTAERQKEICSYLSLGLSKNKAAILSGVSTDTLYYFQRRNPQFYEQMEKAEAKCQAYNLSQIRRASLPKKDGGEGQWTAAAWLLERRFPEEFGRVDRHLIHTTGAERIAERVKAGLRHARAKGKRLGRPRVRLDTARIAALRTQGRSWREITEEMGVSKGSAQRAFCSLPKIV